jgi:hypothetical protein
MASNGCLFSLGLGRVFQHCFLLFILTMYFEGDIFKNINYVIKFNLPYQHTKKTKILESLLPFLVWGTGNASLSLFSPLFLT